MTVGKKNSFVNRLCGVLGVVACCFSPLFSEIDATRQSSPAKIFEISPQFEAINWVNEERKREITLLTIDKNSFISITDLAQISSAQLGWQSVSQQACLSRVQGLVCFNWGNSVVLVDGVPTAQKYQVRFVDNKLYVSFHFTTSKHFQKFTRTELAWSADNKTLYQKTPVTLEIPAVDNLGDHYRLSLSVPSENSYRVMRRNNQQLWLRFSGAQTGGSSLFEGDNVIREIKVTQKRKSADMVIQMGGGSSDYDLKFDPANGKLNLLVYLKDPQALPENHGDAVRMPSLKVESPRINEGPSTSIPTPAPVAVPKAGSSADIHTLPDSPADPVRKEKNVRTIVIDAGHGGFDSGAMGVRGTLEKDINLRVAQAVAERLRQEKNVRVILTRKDDVFLSLDERTKMANHAAGDLFVSIHCNSSLSAKHSGFEVYLLASEASDEAAAAVARFENSVVALESKKGDKPDKLSGLLASMAVNTYINESSELAAVICRGVKKTSTVKETAVKEANFFVLRGAQMPSVLVELDYLSNPISELKLRSNRFTSIVAKGIAQGILAFDERQRKREELISARSNSSRSSSSQ